MYVVVIDDRHSDVEIEIYEDISVAKRVAFEKAKSYSRGFDITSEFIPDGWEACYTYSSDGDKAYVIHRDVVEMVEESGLEHED